MLSPNNTMDVSSSNHDVQSQPIVVVDEKYMAVKSHENSQNQNISAQGFVLDQHSNTNHKLSTTRTSKSAHSINSNLVIPPSTYPPTIHSQDSAADCHTPNLEPHVQLAKIVKNIQRGVKRNLLCKNPHKMKAKLLSQSRRRLGEDFLTQDSIMNDEENIVEGKGKDGQDFEERQLTVAGTGQSFCAASSSSSFESIEIDAQASDEEYSSLLMDHDNDLYSIDPERKSNKLNSISKNGSTQRVISRGSSQERFEQQQQGQMDEDQVLDPSMLLLLSRNEQDHSDVLMNDSFDLHAVDLLDPQPPLKNNARSSIFSTPSKWMNTLSLLPDKEFFEHLFTKQERFLPNSNYLEPLRESSGNHKSHVNISAKNRLTLNDWLCELVAHFTLPPEAKYFCVNVLDRALSKFAQFGTGVQDLEISTRNLQALGSCCFFITAKYFGRDDIRLMHLVGENDERAKKEIVFLERLVLDVLGFELCSVTTVDFMFLFMQLMEDYELTSVSSSMTCDMKEELSQLLFYIGDVQLLCYDLLEFKPSLLALCALVLSLHELEIDYKNLTILRILISTQLQYGTLTCSLAPSSSEESYEKNLNAFNDCLQRLKDYSMRVLRGPNSRVGIPKSKEQSYFVCQHHLKIAEKYFNWQRQQQQQEKAANGNALMLTLEEFLNWKCE
ncbi:hypothetical protein C9374_004714 [Naegleria lovaniensis]|uniref:Cyclin-like domain-containing protein n=1 Tax=Naegleria lovaniensis TaxID=51637 RepID=A0AA88GS72_NAELO|nr:uncharacterized protein C9374_004714 [Naegleria lovaniensis]KAG2383377.1 hypothetical protein C9374_004714 [Naegleria lovaniensis]